MDTIEKLLLVVVGWLLGLLGPAIVDHIRRERENKLGRSAILGELHEVGGLLAIAFYAVRSKEGTLNREHLQWLKAYLEKGTRSEAITNWTSRIDKQLEWSDEELARYTQAMKSKEGKSTLPQKYAVPLLDSRVSALWSFDTEFQRNLLEIRQLLNRLDDLVERSRKLHDMTFSNLDELNRGAVNENIKENISFYADSAKLIVDKIAKLTA